MRRAPITTARALGAALLLAGCAGSAPPAPPEVVVAKPVEAPAPAPSETATARATARPDAPPAPRWPASIVKPAAQPCSATRQPPPRVVLGGIVRKAQSTPPLPAPTATACSALEANRTKRLAALRKAPEGMMADDAARWRDGLLRCAHAGKGAWAIEISAGPKPRWTLVHVTDAGRVLRSGPRALDEYEDVAVSEVFDFDGDGVGEAVVARSRYSGSMDADVIPTFEIHRARGGAIERYPGTRDLVIDNVRDLDGDGRPELELPSRWHFPLHHGEMGEALGPTEAAHALGDGTFSRDDAVAREYARRVCEELDPATDLAPPQPDGIAHVEGYKLGTWVACSRLWGVSASALQAEIKRRFPADLKGPGEPVLDEVLAAARVEPPFTLATPCKP